MKTKTMTQATRRHLRNAPQKPRATEEEVAIEAAIRSGLASPLTRFRVTLLDAERSRGAHGYGPSVEAAERYALAALLARWPDASSHTCERIVEEARGHFYAEVAQ